jgi:hypothetical protein
VKNELLLYQDARYKCKNYRERIYEFCIEVTGCGFTGLVAKCDEYGGTLLAFEKESKEQDECLS